MRPYLYQAMLLALLLAACAPAGVATAPMRGAQPSAVTLYPDTVVVRMPDGALCTGVRSGPGGWSTVLAGCPYAWPVTVSRPTTRPRLPLRCAADPWVRLDAPEGPLGYGPSGGG